MPYLTARVAGCLSGPGCSRWLGREASPGHSLSLPGLLLVLSLSSSVGNCYSLQMETVVMLGRFPVKVRDCKKVSLMCLAEPN